MAIINPIVSESLEKMQVPMPVVQWASHETERQGDPASQVPGLVNAWGYMNLVAIPDHDVLMSLNQLILGIEVWHYRTTPVTFRSGGSAVSHNSVNRRMDMMLALFDETDFREWDDAIVNEWVKGFLDIHPFTDGNGRVASILYNWLMGTLDEPSPLPYYYGEQ